MDFNHTFFKNDVYDLFKDNFDSQNEETKPTIQKSTILNLEKMQDKILGEKDSEPTALDAKIKKSLSGKYKRKNSKFLSGKEINKNLRDSFKKMGLISEKKEEMLVIRKMPIITNEEFDKIEKSYSYKDDKDVLQNLADYLKNVNCNYKSPSCFNSVGGINPLTYLIEASFHMNRKKVKYMNEKFNLLRNYMNNYREINGDGNCYYRAIMFRYIEILILTENIAVFQRFLYDFIESFKSEEIQKRRIIKNNDIKPELTLQILFLIIRLLKQKNITEAHQIFVKCISTCKKFDYCLILYFRYILYKYIKQNENKIYTESFPVKIGNLLPQQYENEKGEFLFDSFYENYLLQFFHDAEKIIIYITPFVLGIEVNVVVYDIVDEEILQKFIWDGESDIKSKDIITLLNNKNHYAIVYTDYDNNKYKNIFEFYMSNIKSVVLMKSVAPNVVSYEKDDNDIDEINLDGLKGNKVDNENINNNKIKENKLKDNNLNKIENQFNFNNNIKKENVINNDIANNKCENKNNINNNKGFNGININPIKADNNININNGKKEINQNINNNNQNIINNINNGFKEEMNKIHRNKVNFNPKTNVVRPKKYFQNKDNNEILKPNKVHIKNNIDNNELQEFNIKNNINNNKFNNIYNNIKNDNINNNNIQIKIPTSRENQNKNQRIKLDENSNDKTKEKKNINENVEKMNINIPKNNQRKKSHKNHSNCENCGAKIKLIEDNPFCKSCFKYLLVIKYFNCFQNKEDPCSVIYLRIKDKKYNLEEVIKLFNNSYEDQKVDYKKILENIKEKKCILCEMKNTISLPCGCPNCKYCMHLSMYFRTYQFKTSFICLSNKKYSRERMLKLGIILNRIGENNNENICVIKYFEERLLKNCCICNATLSDEKYVRKIYDANRDENINKFLCNLNHYLCGQCMKSNINNNFKCKICCVDHSFKYE